jgi:hypothetical protein
VIDSAVDVALLDFGDGALEPGTDGGELTGAQQAVAHLVQAPAESFVIDSAVDVALLDFGDGTLVPGTGGADITVLDRQ